MWLDHAHGGVEEKSSSQRLPGQELASGIGFRVGMRTVSKVFWVEVSGTCIFHWVGEEEKKKSPRFPAQYMMDPRPRGDQGRKESVSRSLWAGSSQGKQMARGAIWGKSRREGP